MNEIRDGDVFRWRYKEPPSGRFVSDPYWAKSCIAIAKKGRLVDTYWGGDFQDSAYWRFEDAIEKLDLTFLGNLDDYEQRQDEPRLYRPEDVMDIRHSNLSSGGLYFRKGAQYAREHMLAECKQRIAQTENDVRFYTDKLNRLKASLARLEAGETLQRLG